MPDNALKGGLGQCQGGQYYAQAPEHVPCQLDDAVSLGARSCMFGKQNCLSQTSLAQNCGIGSGKYRGREVDRPHTNSCSFLLHHFVPPVLTLGWPIRACRSTECDSQPSATKAQVERYTETQEHRGGRWVSERGVLQHNSISIH